VATTVEPRPVVLQPQPAFQHAAAPVPSAEPPKPKAEDVLARAEQRIENGDVTGARELLASTDVTPSGPIAFALAETYDPNMLAAWGTRGVSADVNKAKSLYFKARDLGVDRAQLRLDQLK
jgi:hypothetical protein